MAGPKKAKSDRSEKKTKRKRKENEDEYVPEEFADVPEEEGK